MYIRLKSSDCARVSSRLIYPLLQLAQTFLIAKVLRKFSCVYPALPSDSKDSGWAVAGVIMIVSSANSAVKRSLWGSPIHSSCSIESPRRVPTGGLTSL